MRYAARTWTAALALGILASLPIAGAAETSQFYRPPKILALGTHKSDTPGPGAVQVKVFVKANGSVGSVTIEKSTNHADDAAALEVAKSSKYRPGALDAKPGGFFYTVSLHFTKTSVTSGDPAAAASGVEAARALIREGQYAQAKAALTTYLGTHPNDRDAQTLLGVADTYNDDSTDAATAFDAAGTIPSNYTAVAVKAYGDAALAEIRAKNFDAAAGFATKAIGLAPGDFNLLYMRGTAYANGGHFPEAIADLEKAKSVAAASATTSEKTKLLVDEALASSYLLAGQTEKGMALAQDIKKRDAAAGAELDDAIAASYGKQAAADVADGKRDAAVTAYEAAAAAAPAHAGPYYYAAAATLSGAAKPDWKSVRAEAEKSLAADPTSARANYLAGIAAANSADKPAAIVYLQKAKANVGTDATLGVQVDAALKALGQK
jgi:tetratricopeptide (TPR) repeat protein